LVASEILPNAVLPGLVLAGLQVPALIVAEASLSFLGLGVPPPTASWGGLLNDGIGYVATAWWISVFPGILMTITVVAINSIGQAVRDLVDPRVEATG
jgi:peptide/nickel transport system permease protein